MRISRDLSAISSLRELSVVRVAQREPNEAHVRAAVRARHRRAGIRGRADVRDDELDVSLRQIGRERLAHLVDDACRVFERRARRETHVDAFHRLVDLGEERAREAHRSPRRAGREDHARERDREAERQRAPEDAGVEIRDPVDHGLYATRKSSRLGVAEEEATCDGRHAHAHEIRSDHGDRHGQCERREQLLREPARRSTGSSTAIVVSVEASTGSTTAFVPSSAARVVLMPMRW